MLNFSRKIFFLFLAVLCSGTVLAQFPYSESFKKSTAAGIIFGGAPNPAFLTSASGIDSDGAGYLRLTNNSLNQTGFVRNAQSFNSGDGLDINFEYFTYGGSGADGITFFLFDTEGENAFNIGGFGGSLGYAQRSDLAAPGLSKAYLGIAFDEFGNFSNPVQGRIGGPGQRSSSVTIRGDGNGMGSVQTGSMVPNSNYEFLINTQTSNTDAMSAIGLSSVFQISGNQNGRTAPGGSLDSDEAGYRKARILLEPNGLGTGYKINVYLTENTGGILKVHRVVNDYNYVSTIAAPVSLNYGFASSTGGANNFHEVRNLEIVVPQSIAKNPVLSDLTKSVDEDTELLFSLPDFYSADPSVSKFTDPNGESISKLRFAALPLHGVLKLNGNNISLNQKIIPADIQAISYTPNSNFNGIDSFTWNAADQGGLYALLDASVNLTINPVDETVSADLFQIRIKLANPAYATFTHAKNPFNKSLISIFQVDDSPKTVYNLMYPYLKGGVTAGGYSSPGVKSTDGCGNDLYWNIAVACFIHDNNGVDLLEQGTTYISWAELAAVTATGPGLQRGFDFTNHGFGGSAVLQKDRYKQIFLNNKAAFDKLGFQPEALVVPDTQIGYRFGANDMGMDVTSQAGVEPLKDGAVPLAQDASSDAIYAAINSPYFFRRNHWQEINSATLVTEHKAYVLAAYNKSLQNPGIYNWFSHGPGEIGTSNFAYYRQVIEYMQFIAGDNVMGLSLEQYLGYQKTRYAAENGSGKISNLTPDGYLEISFDMAGLKNTVRHRLLSLLVDSDAQIENITWSENIKAVTFNPTTGLVNIQLSEIVSVDPSTLPVRPTIIAGTPTITKENPKTIVFELDRPISQSVASAYEVEGNPVISVSEVPLSGGLRWSILCQDDFLSTDVVAFTYKAEIGNALDAGNGKKMLTYSKLPVINLSEVTVTEVPALAISVRRDSDNIQLATFNTIEEVKAYMNTFNFNTNISIVFNQASTYSISSKWTLNYNNSNYSLTIKGKDGLATYPSIDAGGLTSDLFRIAMNHVRISQLKLRSGKYTSDGAPFGDNYSGALISQQASTSDCQYTNLVLHQGMRGIRIGAANGTDQPNISDVLIDKVVLTELTGIAIQVGIINSISGQPESRTDASYTLNNVTIRNVLMKDTRNQELIESSGARYSGQIQCRGINNLTLQDIDLDQNQKQPFYIVASKNLLIDRCKATNFSLNTGTGYKAAFHIESSEMITIQNSFVQHSFENVYILGSTGIRLYYNTFDTKQASARAVSLPDARLILDIQGNIFAAKGDNAYNSCLGISFYRGAGYIPTIANDFLSEQNNLFITTSNILEFSGLDAGNTSLSVRVAFSTTFDDYKTSYSRGQGSGFAAYSSLSFAELNGVSGYLADTSVGRDFVSAQINTINLDILKNPRNYPTDAGAYDVDGKITADLSAITLSAGILSPVFSSASTNYTVTVENAIDSIAITPFLSDFLASMTLNGSAVASGSPSIKLPLIVGSNLFTILVTGRDGQTSKTYSITVNRSSVFPYVESYKNDAASGTIFGGNPNAAILTGGGIDANGQGYLRLTTNTNNQTGFARNTTEFPTANGLSISFDYFTYGGSGADGLAFFLYDASANPFSIGGFGGSLGYAQNSSSPGISKAFLGMGLDEFGNFSNPTAGRQGGPGQRPSSVALRGDGNGNAANASNYEYLTGIQTTDANTMAAAGSGNVFQIAGGIDGRVSGNPGISTPGYRRAKINMVPEISGSGFNINVWITEGNSSGGIVHHLIKDYRYVPTNPIPEFLSYGFSAGTGGKNNFHEVRNLLINLPGQMADTEPVVSDIGKTGQENTTLTFTSTDFTSKFSSQENKTLAKVKVISLPSNGTLKLNGINITANQEIVHAELNQISFAPAPGYIGSTGFQWNGSDSSLYALTPAKVIINIIAQSPMPYLESFRNSTATGLITGGVALLTSGSIDAEGGGYLRLNSNAKNQAGFARNTTSFPSAEGLSISFEYFTYGGSGGDGLSFFLYDATANSSFQIGAPGGSLGYAQNSSAPGLSKAYLGFGFDEFGNFSAGTAGRQGGPGQRSSSLTIRGDGNGTGAGSPAGTNYEFLTNIQTTNLAAMSAVGAGSGFTIGGNVDGRTAGADGLSSSMNGYRKVQIEMKPNGQRTGFMVNVWILEGAYSGGINHHLINNYSYVGNTLPANLSYGFAGSTGGASNFHEIRNLSISLPAPELAVPSLMSIKGSFMNNEIDFEADTEIVATNFISPNGDSKNDTWVIRNIEKYPNNTIRIFNRQGLEVYSKKSYRNEWDGTFNGVVLNDDTYFYILNTGAGSQQLRGYISLVR
ncbi:gliding motility-associated C-terminal domain-containing protein [Daejeonella rubra]|uniref:Gliding motility-associated C-terminal domain-containing protein n=1 Tax=Daejeonella rubra TaxID=990371 RepID=A0A1G9Y2C8_9SPHI|nr:gliding motility-associated C-terminal domain-containing protein [Daejeonella rubra]SDN03227.1 gliding motility-associated C-terminal domain-containing protein [Daejeonella rubra]